jgi:tRNA threonylcarbamoyladenosine biosynthesis protein TsaE
LIFLKVDASLIITVRDLTELPAAAKRIIEFAGDHRVFLIGAPMGAGKTTLVRELCKALQSSDHFGSPTYSIINEYDSPNGKIFHFDLYRLQNQEELYDLGIEEYLDSGNYCFIEWPDLLEQMPLPGHIKIKIEVEGEARKISLEKQPHSG